MRRIAGDSEHFSRRDNAPPEQAAMSLDSLYNVYKQNAKRLDNEVQSRDCGLFAQVDRTRRLTTRPPLAAQLQKVERALVRGDGQRNSSSNPTMENNTSEHQRLREKHSGPVAPWRKWGPYVCERSWGSVREDYSPDGCAWEFLTHDMARSKAYRWGEDGIAGICDRYQLLVFALALWNGRDPILKERMFGLSGNEGNHGEDVKEYWFYLDNTPTHSYMKMLYKYPQREFPYQQLIEENRSRWGQVGAPRVRIAGYGNFR